MGLITGSLEISKEVTKEAAKETAAEAAKEAVKTTEGITRFGKIHEAIESESPNFGKIGNGEFGAPISFGSLASGEFKQNENYLRWKDGIDVGELNKSWIRELSNEISAIFGKDKMRVSKLYGMDNAGIYP